MSDNPDFKEEGTVTRHFKTKLKHAKKTFSKCKYSANIFLLILIGEKRSEIRFNLWMLRRSEKRIRNPFSPWPGPPFQ